MIPTAFAMTAPFLTTASRLLTTASALDANAIVMGKASPLTALMRACVEGDNERIRGLLALGADPDVARKHGLRPLHIAIYRGNTKAVEDLLQAGADPTRLPGDDTSPLGDACRKGYVGIVRALVVAGARVNGPDRPSGTGRFRDVPLLGVAIMSGQVEVVEALLQAGASSTAAEYGMGVTPIGLACASPRITGPVRAAIVHLLLQAGADSGVAIQGRQPAGVDPQVAVQGPQPAGADPWVTGQGPPPVCTGSIGSGDPSGTETSRGRPKADHTRAIELAAQCGAAEVIPVLVAAGEDPGRPPADVSYQELLAGVPAPPLFAAARKGHANIVQALVAAGADVDATVGGSGTRGDLSTGLEGGSSGAAAGGEGDGGADGGGCDGMTPL